MVWYLWCSRRRDCDRKAAGGSVAGRVARRTGDSSSAKGEGAATGRGTRHRNRPRYRVTGCRRVGDHRPTGAGRLAREIARQIQRRWRGIHNGDGKVTVCRVAGGIARRAGDGGDAEREGAATGRGTGDRHYTRYGVTGRCEETHALSANVSLAIMALSWLRIINSPGFDYALGFQ